MDVHAPSFQSFEIELSDGTKEEREKEAELAKSKIVEIFKVRWVDPLVWQICVSRSRSTSCKWLLWLSTSMPTGQRRPDH